MGYPLAYWMIGMNRKLNAIVLAGTHGAKPFSIDGKRIRKQYVEICGKTLVERVVEAVLGAELIRNVYVVGNVEELKVYLRDNISDRCILIEQRNNVVNNILDTFARHVVHDIIAEVKDRCSVNELMEKYANITEERIFVISSDILFPSADTIDEFISQSNGDVDIEAGVTDREAVVEFLHRYCLMDYDENVSKTAFFPVGKQRLRINNMAVMKPLKIHPALYGLYQNLIEDRDFIDEKGHVKHATKRRVLRILSEYAKESSGSSYLKRIIIYRALLNAFVGMALLVRAKKNGSGSRFINERDVAQVMKWFSGLKIKHTITNSLSVIDLDTPYTFNYFKGKGVFDRIYGSCER